MPIRGTVLQKVLGGRAIEELSDGRIERGFLIRYWRYLMSPFLHLCLQEFVNQRREREVCRSSQFLQRMPRMWMLDRLTGFGKPRRQMIALSCCECYPSSISRFDN